MLEDDGIDVDEYGVDVADGIDEDEDEMTGGPHGSVDSRFFAT